MADQLTPTHAVRSTVPSPAGDLAALIGTPKAGTPQACALLVPGYTGSKEDFAPILDPLAEAGFRAVAVEMPGQHESSGPDDETAYSPAALGPVIAEVVRQLAVSEGPVIVLGHSFGGLVCRQAILAGAPVAGLVLLGSGPAAFSAGRRFDELTLGPPLFRQYGPAAFYDLGQRALGLDPARPDPIAQFHRRRFLSSSPAAILGMGHWLLHEPDLVDELGAALALGRIPVAVVAGEQDDAWPLSDQQEMATRLGTRLVLVENAAHSPAIENPVGLLAILLPLFSAWSSGD